MLHMKTIAEIRYENLEKLVLAAAGPGGDIGRGLSSIVNTAAGNGRDLSRPTLYQIITKKETASGTIKGVGDDLARSIEDALRLERGWMDNDHADRGAEARAEVSPEVITELISVYCYTDDIGRKGIRAAVDVARRAVPSTAFDNLKSGLSGR